MNKDAQNRIDKLYEETVGSLRKRLGETADRLTRRNLDYNELLEAHVKLIQEMQTREGELIYLKELQIRAAELHRELEADVVLHKDRYKDLSETFTNFLNDIWEIAYPGEPTTWDYPAQVFRHIRDYTEELKEEVKRLREQKDAPYPFIRLTEDSIARPVNDEDSKPPIGGSLKIEKYPDIHYRSKFCAGCGVRAGFTHFGGCPAIDK